MNSGGTPPSGLLSRIHARIGEWGGRDPYNLAMGFTISLVLGIGFASLTTAGSAMAQNLLDGIRGIADRHFEQKAAPDPRPGEPPASSEPAFLEWWLLIVKQNLRVALISAAGGILARFIPWGVALLNGVGLGMCLIAMRDAYGLGPVQLFVMLAPHGVLEIPALLLACLIGVRLHRVASPPTMGGRWKAFLGSWRALALVGGMLLAAAAIEAR